MQTQKTQIRQIRHHQSQYDNAQDIMINNKKLVAVAYNEEMEHNSEENAELEIIKRDLVALSEIQRDFNELVVTQQDNIDIVEQELESTEAKIDDGIEDLTSAFSLSRNSIKAIAIGGVVGVSLVAGPLVAAGVAGKLAVGTYLLSGTGGIVGGYVGKRLHHN